MNYKEKAKKYADHELEPRNAFHIVSNGMEYLWKHENVLYVLKFEENFSKLVWYWVDEKEDVFDFNFKVIFSMIDMSIIIIHYNAQEELVSNEISFDELIEHYPLPIKEVWQLIMKLSVYNAHKIDTFNIEKFKDDINDVSICYYKWKEGTKHFMASRNAIGDFRIYLDIPQNGFSIMGAVEIEYSNGGFMVYQPVNTTNINVDKPIMNDDVYKALASHTKYSADILKLLLSSSLIK